MQADSVFSGISTFGRIEYQPCLSNKDVHYDIAFIGSPAPKSTCFFSLMYTQALHLIPAPRTVPAPASAPAASGKVLAASISSM